MYNPQDPYQPAQPQNNPSQNPYQPQYPYPPQGPTYEQSNAYPPQGMYQPPYQGQYPPYNQQFQGRMNIGNPRASRAMIYGIISLILGLLTLVTLVGFAGLITGTFAIVYGFIGLQHSRQFPGKPGQVQAVAGMVLGALAWLLVIVSFALRGAMHTP